ncbi:uncharacterized protein LOC133176888 isoform X2 [Saccostrea echinata]|uniref:uncharacterized protein LOC133176888 isoform X2 n=1 Tax=Saccostrea echinata TaxID=191078 RepID=UPI002A83CA36|nr:uncharacterized protein LOC133176888 isoform X2 [Saccostrea echinata]
MGPKDFVRQGLSSPVLQKSGIDFKSSSLSQHLLPVQSYQRMDKASFFNATLNDTLINNATTTTPPSTKIWDKPNSKGFLAVAIPLLITGVVAILILVLVCFRCKKKRDAYYGEPYDFSLVDQSIQANQSSILGHGVIMAQGTEYRETDYHEIGDVEEPANQMDDNQNGVLRFHEDVHNEAEDHYVDPCNDKEYREKLKSYPPSNTYVNDYFSVCHLGQSPYFVLEPGLEPRYVNER